jgi:BlaI family penicillinase repressor
MNQKTSKPVRISDAEWHIMNLVWRQAPVTAADIVNALSARVGWRSRTIRTLLDRLVKKGALKISHDGKRFLYEPLVKLETCVRQESRSFLQRVFGGRPAPMLLHLVSESELSREEIKQLKRLLTQKEK